MGSLIALDVEQRVAVEDHSCAVRTLGDLHRLAVTRHQEAVVHRRGARGAYLTRYAIGTRGSG